MSTGTGRLTNEVIVVRQMVEDRVHARIISVGVEMIRGHCLCHKAAVHEALNTSVDCH